jgi:hypothetical protein
MPPADVKPTRVKLYGFLWMTKRTYLIIQSVVYVVLLGVLAAGAVAMAQEGRALPALDPGRQGLTAAWVIRQVLIGFFWLGLLTAVLEGIETLVVLRMFAREEAKELAPRAAPDPQAVQQPVTKPEP